MNETIHASNSDNKILFREYINSLDKEDKMRTIGRMMSEIIVSYPTIHRWIKGATIPNQCTQARIKKIIKNNNIIFIKNDSLKRS